MVDPFTGFIDLHPKGFPWMVHTNSVLDFKSNRSHPLQNQVHPLNCGLHPTSFPKDGVHPFSCGFHPLETVVHPLNCGLHPTCVAIDGAPT
jgi:hypothetical protein